MICAHVLMVVVVVVLERQSKVVEGDVVGGDVAFGREERERYLQPVT